MRLCLWCVLLVEMLAFWFVWWSEALEKEERWRRLSVCLYQHGIMALMIVYEGLGLLIARDDY